MIPESHQHLLRDETRSLAYLATVMQDGSPQLTPVWFSFEDDLLKINTRRGRVKERNLTARPQAAVVIQDPSDSYRFIQIRGKVLRSTEDGAADHIDRLSRKYDGKAFRPLEPDEIRVIFHIEPTSVSINE